MFRFLIGIIAFLLLNIIALQTAQAQATPPGDTPELVLQIGHMREVTSVVFSPDGRLLASVSLDHTLKLWDGHTGALKLSLNGHRAATQAAAFAPDSGTIYSAGRDGNVRLWDVRTGTLLGTITGFPPDSTASALWCGTNNGTGKTKESFVLIATAYSDKTIHLWKAKAGRGGTAQEIAKLEGHQALIHALAFSPDGQLLASGDHDGNLKTWDTEDGSLQRALHSHAMPIRSLAFSSDSNILADASDDGITNRWNMKTGKELDELQLGRPGDGEGAVAFSPDGKSVATGGFGIRRDENLKLWEAQSAHETLSLKGHEGFVSAAAFSPDSSLLATGGRDNTVRLWDTRTGKEVGASGRRDFISAVAFAPTGDLLASAGADGLVRLWDVHTGELKQALAGHRGAVFAVAFTPDGKSLVSGGRDGQLLCWNPQTGQRQRVLASVSNGVNAIAFSPDGKTLAAGCGHDFEDGSVPLFDLATGRLLTTLDGESLAPVRALAYSPDGSLIATASESNGGGETRFWEATTGKLLHKEFAHGLHSLAFTPEGKTLAVGGAVIDDQGERTGGEITLWNGRTQALQKKFAIPFTEAQANALAYLDKQRLLVGGADGRLLLFDAKSGDAPSTLFHNNGAILTVSLSPDGKMLAFAGRDNTIHLWSVERNALLVSLIPLPVAAGSHLPQQEAQPIETDWLAVTPAGYYDGSAGAGRLIRWRIQGSLFPVEAFEGVLHRPKEIRAALSSVAAASLLGLSSGGGPAPKPGLTGVSGSATTSAPIALATLAPPRILFQTPLDGQPVSGETVRVKLSITDARKVSHLEVLANGRPVGAKPLELDAKPLELDAKPLELDAKPLEVDAKHLPPGHKVLQQFQVDVPLPPGETQIALTAQATDDQGLQGREEIHLTRGGMVPVTGTLYVLSVGVSQYQNPKYNLKYAASDAAVFANLWQPQSGTLYSNVKATCLTDAQATSNNIRAAFLKLLEQATDRDSVVIFLSGHGVQATESEYFFAAQDIDVANLERVRATGLPWTALQTTLAALHAKRVVLFLDACHSGNALGVQQSSSERMAELLVKRAGVMVFASSRGSEYSYELSNLQHGAFTAAIMEGLGEGKADFEIGGQKDGTITAEELLAYLRARVPQLTDHLQTPTCPLLRDFGDDAPLAHVK